MQARPAAALAAVAAAVSLSFLSSGQLAAQQSAAPQKTSVTVVQVRPEAIEAWRDFQAKQTVPALKKIGVAQRDVYESIYGQAAQFRVVQPLAEWLAPYMAEGQLVSLPPGLLEVMLIGPAAEASRRILNGGAPYSFAEAIAMLPEAVWNAVRKK